MDTNRLEVWIDADFLGEMVRVGVLAHDRGNIRFNYDNQWMAHSQRFDIDPDLSLDNSTFHPNPVTGNFGIFLDSSPDRWGQTLMKRREALEAKDQKRPTKTLHAWDFLIGVQDFTRQGALRFKFEGTDKFLSDHKLAAPPVTMLKELEAVAKELTSKHINNLDELKRWLSVLVAPGASLGGARPKANFTDPDGSKWIAKFPSKDDDLDIGAWEGVVHNLAITSNIDVPSAKTIKLSGGHHTFCVKRFDRHDNKRVFYASAMTLLKRSESEGASYLDLAQFLMTNGAKSHVTQDLEQLFRRVVFNVAVGNRDDHLRNHGFILTKDGWRPSPAFDINPSIYKSEHVLNLDDVDNRPSMATVLTTAELYELAHSKAEQIIEEIVNMVHNWQKVARKAGISNAEIELMSSAFLQHDNHELTGGIGW
jgi:serine/threonine-protein kinase HipA